MNKIILFLILFLILISLTIKMRKKSTFIDVYENAYQLGKKYIDDFPLSSVKNAAIMFDIDDTLLAVNGLNGLNGLNLTPIKPIIKLLKYADKKGIYIIIITARDSIFTSHTKKDLKENNINYDELYLRKSPKDNYELFKSDIKKQYTLNGYNIIMSVGDNDIDVIGNYSGYSLKLPNNSDSRLYEKRLDGNIYIIN